MVEQHSNVCIEDLRLLDQVELLCCTVLLHTAFFLDCDTRNRCEVLIVHGFLKQLCV